MNTEIQPKFEAIKVVCSCGYETSVKSTYGKELHIETCAYCHPFYTGKQKGAATGGRIERFNRRFKKDSNKERA